MRECIRRGVHPADMSADHLQTIIIGEAKTRELVRGAVARAGATVRSKIRPVSDVVLTQRRAVCHSNECGYHVRTTDGVGFCMKCCCGGRGLASKLSDPRASCPDIPPRWGPEL